MKSLNDLDLSNNQISFIENNSFSSLNQLNYLDLRSNKLTRLKLLSNMESLNELDLSNNQISFIENNSFSSLKQLTKLYLKFKIK